MLQSKNDATRTINVKLGFNEISQLGIDHTQLISQLLLDDGLLQKLFQALVELSLTHGSSSFKCFVGIFEFRKRDQLYTESEQIVQTSGHPKNIRCVQALCSVC